MNAESTDSSNSAVQCPPTTEPAVRWFIPAALSIGLGIYCFIDKENYPPPEVWGMKEINEIAGYIFNHWKMSSTSAVLIFS